MKSASKPILQRAPGERGQGDLPRQGLPSGMTELPSLTEVEARNEPGLVWRSVHW